MNVSLIARFLCMLMLVFSCSSENPMSPSPENPSGSATTIMPLGASRVEGARPEYESYRYELWKLLVDSGVAFDFVGTRDDTSSYPTYTGRRFDPDHEGRGGFTSGQILQGLPAWLQQTGGPDIVLLSSPGGNDALTNQSYEQALTNIKAIIDLLQSANPRVTIIIEQLAPAMSSAMTPQLTAFFNQMQEDVPKIAMDERTATSTILVVDMATGFGDSLLADDVHYNEAGAGFIAARYYDVLQGVLEN
ncbi:GDSL-type esterase/lipase family protein [Flagellimonas sp. DF-77]|uniref:GDSL-type esterase/lipase family protein n=1 Tax=Flagellimonas algarum TaxID=3230298 RepID=UPI00339282EA